MRYRSASWASARARKTRCCCPPESWLICRIAKSCMPTRSSAFMARWRCCFRTGLEPTDLSVQPHRDRFQRVDRKVPVDRTSLRNVAHAASLFSILATVDRDAARDCRDEIQGRLNECALASSVWTDDRDQLARRGGVVDVPQNRLPVIRNGHVVNGKRRPFWVRDFAGNRLGILCFRFHVGFC